MSPAWTRVSADRRLPAAVLDALAAEGKLEVVEHGAVPINFACPNVIVQHADGTRTGISDAASPWSAPWRSNRNDRRAE